MAKALLASARSTEVLPMGSTPSTLCEIVDRNRAVRFAQANVRRGMERTGAFVEDAKNQQFEALSARLSHGTIVAILNGEEVESRVAQDLGWDPAKKQRLIEELVAYIFGLNLEEREYDPSLDLKA